MVADRHGIFVLVCMLPGEIQTQECPEIGQCGCVQEVPQGLQDVLKRADATGKLRIVQQMSINIIPIIEKGLLDPVITHGWVLVS